MKSFLITVLAVMLFALPGTAQDQIGIKGGVNLSNYAGDVMDNKIKLGIHLGAFVNFNIVDQLYIQPELLYSLQGAHLESSISNLDYNEHLHYINVPILARYFLTENISVHAGPYVGVKIGGKAKGTYYGTEIDRNIDDHRMLKGFDFGLACGVAYQLVNRVNIGARIQFGVMDIAEMPDFTGGGDGIEPEYNYGKLNNRVIQIYAAIPLKN